jgi:sterol desaturase/sphingolipid hydroxylase (fatty acid hydroxylase superfamily)
MAVSWLLFAGWAIPAFVMLEGMPRGRALTIACALLAANVAVTYVVGFAPTRGTLARSIGAFALAEVFAYAAHRAQHALPCLWRFHYAPQPTRPRPA